MKEYLFGKRAYYYNRMPFPERIAVDGRDILASPIKLSVKTSGGKEAVWNEEEPFMSGEGGYYETEAFSGISYDAEIMFNASVRFEDDGFVWCDLTLVPRWYKKPDVSSISIDIPLKKSVCRLINACSLERTLPDFACGAMPEKRTTLPFVPSLWIGDENGGLAVSMESERGTILSDPDVMFEMIPDDEAYILRIHLLDSCPDGWDSDSPPLVFGFGMTATPVREYAEVPDLDRALHVSLESLYNPMFDHIAEQGIKYVIFHENWSIVQNYGLPRSDLEIREQIERCHRMGMKTLAYFGYEYASNAPGFAENWSKYLIRSPEGRLRGGYERHEPSQRDFIVCYNSGYAQVLEERVRKAMDDYGFDGIYTDGALMTFPCANEAHGCGWRDNKGGLHYTHPILAWRKLHRSLTEIVHSRGGIIDSHNGGYCVPALYSFTDSILDGEALQEKFFTDISKFADTGLMRSQFGGRNFGVPSQFIIYHKELVAPLTACGIPCRFFGFEEVALASEIWKKFDRFGAENAEYIPPWDDRGIMSVSESKTICSAWIRKEKDSEEKILISVYNLEENEKEVSIDILGRSVSVVLGGRQLRLIEV